MYEMFIQSGLLLHIYVDVLDNGLFHVWRLAITSTIVVVFFCKVNVTNQTQWKSNQNASMSFNKNPLRNVVCIMFDTRAFHVLIWVKNFMFTHVAILVNLDQIGYEKRTTYKYINSKNIVWLWWQLSKLDRLERNSIPGLQRLITAFCVHDYYK